MQVLYCRFYGMSFRFVVGVWDNPTSMASRVRKVGVRCPSLQSQIVATNPCSWSPGHSSAFAWICSAAAYVYDAGGRMGRFISYGSLGWLSAITAASSGLPFCIGGLAHWHASFH